MSRELMGYSEQVLRDYPELLGLTPEEKFIAMPSAKNIDCEVPDIEGMIRALDIPDLDKLVLQHKLDKNPYYEYALNKKYDITKAVIDWCESRLTTHANIIAEFYGISRVSKSYSTISFQKSCLDFDFTPEQTFFLTSELNEHAKDFKKGSGLTNDDKTEEIGVGSRMIEGDFNKMIQVVGKYGLSIVNCATKPKIREAAHLEFESICLNRSNFKSRFLVHFPNITDGTKNFEPIGYIEFDHPLKYVKKEFILSYESRKNTFIDSIIGRIDSDRVEIKAQEVMDSELYLKNKLFFMKIKKKSQIPAKSLMNLVGHIYPKYQMNNMVKAITQRIVYIEEQNEMNDVLREHNLN